MTYKFNNFKFANLTNNNNIGRAISRLALALNPVNRALGYVNLGRGLYNTFTRRRRGNRRNRIPNKIEINKAEGGYKQVYNAGKTHQQTIEAYASIYMNTVNEYIFKSEDIMQNPKFLDLKAILNDNDEFNVLRRFSLQYKVVQISVSFNYNRVPKAGEKLSKIILTPETDTVDYNDQPKQNSNNMIWDMTANGTKNYSFRINPRNTEKVNQEWSEGEAQFSATVKLHISEQGINEIQDNVDGICLGEFKIAYSVLYVKRDTEFNVGKISDKAIIQKIVRDNRSKYEKEFIEDQIAINNKKIEKIKENNKKLKESVLEGNDN